MKKSLILLPLVAALLCAGCTSTKKSGKKKKSDEPSGSVTPPGPVEVTWPSVQEGDGSEANPYNPTQAREEAKKLEVSTVSNTVIGTTDVYVRGYVCVIEDIALDRPRSTNPSIIDNDVKFYLADSAVSCTNEEVGTQDAVLADKAFGVYFATWMSASGKWTDYAHACSIYGCLVTVKGRLQNWVYCPQINSEKNSHPFVTNVGDKYAGADPNYEALVTEAQAHGEE